MMALAHSRSSRHSYPSLRLPEISRKSLSWTTLPISLFLARLYTTFIKQTLCFCDFAKNRGEGGTPYFTALVLILLPILAAAQGTPAGSIYGYVLDPDHRPIPEARIIIEDPSTGATRATSTNQQGFYSVPALQPAQYNLTIQANGFATIHQTGVVLEADQQARLDFSPKVGATSETITVEGNAPLLNTSDATVSTLIGNQFVTNMPLNGRSFSTLINLTPGVVLTPTTTLEQGQFSVNGQRPDANYFMVDGVSANLGNAGNGGPLGQSGAGQLPATSAFGGMSNLVSLDALQEFRIQTSTFAPEYGRTPGAQVSVVTKSGTNAFHGTAFEYFRNDVLDANNWFADHLGLRKPELRQNDFGGVLGGPIKKDKLFFFGSYEGLRVRQPKVANTYVPTLATIQSAPAAVQPLLNAFPKPNGADLGNGTAGFSASYSDPSSLNASSIRLDYLPTSNLTVFGRYDYAPSSLDPRGGGNRQNAYSNVAHLQYRFQSLTLGSNQAITPRWTNEFRFNYSRNRAQSSFTLDNFGGAVPPPDSVLYPYPFAPPGTSFAFFGDFNPYGLKFLTGAFANNLQRQINITDNISHSIGAHQLKFGLDYRRLSPEVELVPYQVQYVFGSLSNILVNKVPQAYINSQFPQTLAFSNWSLFAQDTWNITRNLTITYGLRWEYDTAPSSPNGTTPYTVNQVNDFATMTLAPAGTPLWTPQKDDFAPRLAIAWNPRSDLVIRAGAGIFYDLGYSGIANGTVLFPYDQTGVITNVSFPLSANAAAPLPFRTTPPVSFLAVIDPNHVLPRTYEWNAAVEQSLGSADVLTLTYLGAAGRKLMRQDIYNSPNPNFTGQFYLMRNDADSSYNALQVQYRHRLTHGLQALASYTWGHAIDDASSDVNFQNVPPGASPVSDRGPSDYDIRNTFAGAVSYYIPGPKQGWVKPILENWSVNTIVYARSAPPVNVVTGKILPGTILAGANSVQRPNVVPGQPIYISNPTAPGGRIINKAAFTVPVSGQGDLGRNALRGFNASQVDFTLQRTFKLSERFSLKSSADFFNIFNHPQFGAPINYMTSPQFGYSTQTLNSWLGSGGQNGGLNPLYQIGGPRSIQLALKLQF